MNCSFDAPPPRRLRSLTVEPGKWTSKKPINAFNASESFDTAYGGDKRRLRRLSSSVARVLSISGMLRFPNIFEGQ